MSFETEQKKIRKETKDDNQISIDTNRAVRYDLINNDENILKTPRIIHLIKGYNFTFGIVSESFDSRVTVLYGGPDEIGIEEVGGG